MCTIKELCFLFFREEVVSDLHTFDLLAKLSLLFGPAKSTCKSSNLRDIIFHLV